MSNTIVRWAILVLLLLPGAFLVNAEDQPKKDQDNKPEASKNVKFPKAARWKESDVRNFLDLPYLISLDEIAGRLNSADRIGKYKIGQFRKHDVERGRIQIEIVVQDVPVFCVFVYDYRSWNNACSDLLEYLITSFNMWSRIPEFYKIERADDMYVVRTNGPEGTNVQKWYFDSRRQLVIVVNSDGVIKPEVHNIAQIDQVIQSLVSLFEGKDGEQRKTPAEGGGQKKK